MPTEFERVVKLGKYTVHIYQFILTFFLIDLGIMHLHLWVLEGGFSS
jgi:hypothetical protein